jgi:hypothetical protein
MRRLFYLLLGLLFISSPVAWGQTSVWKVTHNDNVLYLGGTLHLLKATDYPLPAQFEMAFTAAENIVLEADLALMQDPAVMAQMQAKMMYQDGRSLKSVLSTEVYEKLEAFMQSRGLPIQMFQFMTAGAVSITLSVMEMQRLGFLNGGVDHHYYQKAESANKELMFLETVEQQIDFIASLGEGIENEMIASTIDDMNQLSSYMDQMTADWRNGNLQGLMDVQLAELLEYRSVYDAILLERNLAWIPKIEAMLATPETETILVGVLHMVGEDGLLALLRQQGYTVTQLH